MAAMCLLLLTNSPPTNPRVNTRQVPSGSAEFDERSFFDPATLAGFRSRHRLLVSGMACSAYVIRIDELLDGKILGVVKSRHHCNSNETKTKSRQFAISRRSMDNLLAKFKRAGLWRTFPEFWESNDPQFVCLDGIDLVFERLTEAGAGFSVANAQCTAPQDVLDAAREMIVLSGEQYALRLLKK